MVLNDFYIIVSETPKTAVIERIGTKWISGDGQQGNVIANPDVRTGETFKVLKKDGEFRGSLGMHSTHTLEVWNGEPKYTDTCD